MKIFYIQYKTLYRIALLVLIMLIIIFTIKFLLNNDANEIFNEDIFYKGTNEDKIIAFTCNVDWGNEFIPTMLEIFKKENIKITFFVTGRWAEKNPDLLKFIYNDGHEIGNHGYLHKDYSMLKYDMNRKEILKCHMVLKEILDINSKYFAPPSGAYNEHTIAAAKDLGYDVIMWSIDTIDWRKDSTMDKISNRVLSKAENSAIVLMHPKEETVKALPYIIGTLKTKGYKIGRVSDVINWRICKI